MEPLHIFLMFGIENWEGWCKSHLIFPLWNTSLKTGGEIYIFLNALNIAAAKIWRFLVHTLNDLPFSSRFSKDDVLSFYITRRHLSRERVILPLVVRLSDIQASGRYLILWWKKKNSLIFFFVHIHIWQDSRQGITGWLVLLVISLRCSVKLSSGSTFIPSNFSHFTTCKSDICHC